MPKNHAIRPYGSKDCNSEFSFISLTLHSRSRSFQAGFRFLLRFYAMSDMNTHTCTYIEPVVLTKHQKQTNKQFLLRIPNTNKYEDYTDYIFSWLASRYHEIMAKLIDFCKEFWKTIQLPHCLITPLSSSTYSVGVNCNTVFMWSRKVPT